jgi:Fur family ferric uptake transcriptional regulator
MLDRLPFFGKAARNRRGPGRRRERRRAARGMRGHGEIHRELHHRLEREQFEGLLAAMRATRIPDRLAVLDVFLSTEKHLTLAELADLMRNHAPELCDRAFLAETMDLFCSCGFAHRRDFDGRDAIYEHQHLGQHHDHLICTGCGRIEEFISLEIEREQVETAARYGFHPLQHRMEIYGLCGECMAARAPEHVLARAAVGERVQVRGYEDGCPEDVRRRLAAMGLVPGAMIEVLNTSPGGPVIVAAGDSRLALDGELAAGLVVRHACHW